MPDSIITDEMCEKAWFAQFKVRNPSDFEEDALSYYEIDEKGMRAALEAVLPDILEAAAIQAIRTIGFSEIEHANDEPFDYEKVWNTARREIPAAIRALNGK